MMLRRWQRFKAVSFASTTEKLRPQARERRPTALHTNAEASEEAIASNAVANASENKILPMRPTPYNTMEVGIVAKFAVSLH
jgi:hypothetical protein